MSRTVVKLGFIGICLLAFSSTAYSQSSATARAGNSRQPVAESDRTRDGLIGPVRRIRTSVAKLVTQDGRQVEGSHVVLEVVAYDVKGNKIENQYFPIAGGTLTGKEVYKYDDRGNISEMTLINADGTLLSRETYKYEYDFAGNWNKMTTSVAVIEGGRVTFEPTEVTYRSIMYYLDENMIKMVSPGTTPSSAQTSPNTAPVSSNTSVPTSSASSVANNQTARPPVKNSSPNTKQPGGRKNAPASVAALPSANTSSERLSNTGSVEAKTAPVNSNASVPMVNLGDEPPTPAPKPTKPVSGGVLNGTAISLPSPIYPDNAKRMRLQGVVTVDVILDETGKVISAEASSGPNALREAAVQAARRARFSPTKLSGMPVKVSGVINYKFALLN